MSKAQNRWFAISLFLIATTILASSVAIFYYTQYGYANNMYQETLSELRSSTYTINMAIKFCNGTQIWHNNTIIPIGWSLFNSTQKVTDGNLNYTIFYGSPFITSILGVKAEGTHAWLWWAWNSTTGSWQLGEVGSAQYVLKDKSIVIWYLEDTLTWPPPGP